MGLRAIPMILLSLFFYSLVVFAGGWNNPDATQILDHHVMRFTLPSQASWVFTWGDLIMLVTMGLLFVELLKSTIASETSLVDHALSLVVFIVCLLLFVLVKYYGTSLFFMITMACLIDVVAGYTIGFQTAKRNLNIGTN